ncbi:MAG: D-glycerate dehydrogenase, partial [Pseudomonadota bacterium]
MRELFETQLNLSDTPMTEEELVAAVKTADVLVPTVSDDVNAGVIEQAGDNLKLIANFGNGTDNIDVKAAQARGITTVMPR